ncbi:hypothetical protein CC2G_002746 [Coprinopsis cinerea AmutBmut pab1-1]|nr:hypothetical protein CC2G_002746 [Coprinopsis cinerea AmutBmut pab1-1]
MYFGFLGTTLAYLIREVIGDTNAEFDVRFSLANILLTGAFNIIITSLICFRLIRAHSKLSRLLPGRNMRAYRNVVNILTESALPIALFGPLAAILYACAILGRMDNVPARLYVTARFFDNLYCTFAALSPQLIIFRVTTGRSFTSYEQTKVGNRTTRISQPIIFYNGRDLDTMDVEESRSGDGRGDSDLGTENEKGNTGR